MKRIDKLTPGQEARLGEWRDKWIAIGLKTGETDKERCERGLKVAYEKTGIKFPGEVVWVKSPPAGALAASHSQAILRGVAVHDVVRDAVNGVAVHDVVRDAVNGAVGVAVHDVVRDAVNGAVDVAVGVAVGGAVGVAVHDVVRGAVRDAVRDAVDDAVRDAVDDAVRVAVHDVVRDAVNGAVDVAVGVAVHDVVRDAVRVAVDGAVNVAVRDAVVVAVDAAVGVAVDAAVVVADLEWHQWLGGQFWVGGWWGSPSYVSFFTDVCGLELDADIKERADAYRDICESANYIWPNRNFIIACERPQLIARNDEGRLHNDQGKAIEYGDGWGLYALDGVILKEDIWKAITSHKMTLAEMFAIEDADIRAVALKYNQDALIADGGELLDEHPTAGELYLVKNREINKLLEKPEIYFLKMKCPTGRTFVEAVDPGYAKQYPYALHCQAKAWGIDASIYEGVQNHG